MACSEKWPAYLPSDFRSSITPRWVLASSHQLCAVARTQACGAARGDLLPWCRLSALHCEAVRHVRNAHWGTSGGRQASIVSQRHCPVRLLQTVLGRLTDMRLYNGAPI